MQLDKFHSAFPCMSVIQDKVWKHTAKTLYEQIVKRECPLFPLITRDFEMLKIGNEKEDKMSTTPRSETTELANQILEKCVDTKWVSVLSGRFPAYFDDLKWVVRIGYPTQYYYGMYRQNHYELLKLASKESEFLSGLLKNLGMTIIESPMWIFSSMRDAGIDVQNVSPKEVLRFLKSFSSNETGTCNITKINVSVSETSFRDVHGVCYITKFCLMDKTLSAADFSEVPLLTSESEHLRVFEEANKIFLTSVKDLLPQSANNIAHSLQRGFLANSEILKTFVKNMEIQDFSNHLKFNFVPNLISGSIEPYEEAKLPNKTWITHFWRFLAENCFHLERMSIRKMTMDKKTVETEKPLNVLISTVLKYLGDCSFLPAFTNGTQNLYPLKFGKHVLKILPYVDNPEQLALKDLNVPLLDETCFTTEKRCSIKEKRCILEILKCLLASVENVIDTLNCLYFNRTALNCQMTACETMLKFFDRNLKILRKDINCRMKLRHLPFYSGLDKNFISLKEREIILLPDEIPTEGLKEFGLRCSLTFIRPKDVSRDFWEYLGCVTTTSTELYIKHVLPKFNSLPNTAILQHLKFIKDIMISRLNYDNDKQKLLSLDYLLRDIAFIPAGENRLARACEFFNPHKEIFKIENQLCRESEVPPSPFDGEEWEEFLIHCGMKSDMTPEIFIDFAKRVEKLGDVCGLTSLVRDNSYRMVDILLSDDTSTITMNYEHIIQKIRFLYPHQVRQVLQMLVPQFEGGNRLVCFQDSTMPSNGLLVWTVMGIFAEDIQYKMRAKTDNMTATKYFGLLEPPLQNVLDHINILCHALSGSMSEICAKNTDIEAEVTRVMTKIYEFLSKRGNGVSVRFLSDVPFIFIKDRRLFVLPEQIVLEMNAHEEIPPYLCKMPVYFGQFHSVFKMHGAAETLTCGHLARVLLKIWKKSEGKILEPNEISSTKTAVKTLFSKLSREFLGDLNDFDLYLPSKSQRLIKSSALVFIDDKRLEERIKVTLSDMEYFVGFTELSMTVNDHVSEINRLPAKHLPQFLSKVVKEQIEKECKRLVVSSDFARTLQKFLHSIELVAGICRLVRHEQYENDDRCGEGKEIEIQKKLQSVRVRCVEQIKTLLFFEDKPLPNTTESKAVFSAEELDEDDSPILCIYLSETTVSRDSFYKENWNIISKHLNAFLGKPIKENIIHLPDILACIDEPKSIESKLDYGEIRRLESLDQRLPTRPGQKMVATGRIRPSVSSFGQALKYFVQLGVLQMSPVSRKGIKSPALPDGR
uniref:Sacsin-like isoform X4 n=1 Tax=Crassostrea virginica TaxID=6565 RepID=A0A8B8D7K1_CRAVI|nr:sacsin-like isoform X4 [Crassostrea virginica]